MQLIRIVQKLLASIKMQMKIIARFGLIAGIFLKDLFVFDTATVTWTDLSPSTSGTGPSARRCHGFTAAGGKLYVHAGFSSSFGNNGLHCCYEPIQTHFSFWHYICLCIMFLYKIPSGQL